MRQIMKSIYPIDQKKAEVIEKGATHTEAYKWEVLTCDITQVIETKQLVTTMQTQYMHTVFQIPFDAHVRIRLAKIFA